MELTILLINKISDGLHKIAVIFYMSEQVNTQNLRLTADIICSVTHLTYNMFFEN